MSSKKLARSQDFEQRKRNLAIYSTALNFWFFYFKKKEQRRRGILKLGYFTAFTFFDAKKSNKKRHERLKSHFSFFANPSHLPEKQDSRWPSMTLAPYYPQKCGILQNALKTALEEMALRISLGAREKKYCLPDSVK